MPLVSIIIPTYNRAELLRGALNSALQQHHRNIQIIVSDNASTDHTQDVLKQCADPRVVKYRQLKNVGPIKNCNICLSLAKGQYTLVLSDDDSLMPDCISSMVEQFLAHPSATIIYGRTRNETTNGELIVNTKPSPVSLESGTDYVMNWINGKRETSLCCTMFRSSWMMIFGGIPNFPTSDSALRAVVALQGDVIFINKILASYRVHHNSDSHSYSITQWIEENRKMIEYINNHMPITLREEFLMRGIRYTIRSTGSIFGDILSGGMYRGENLMQIKYFVNIFGWKDFLTNWPWLSVLSKALLPNNCTKYLRYIRNNTFR